MKLGLLITFSICMESSGVSYTIDCHLLNRLKKFLFLERVEEVRVGVIDRSGMISNGGGGHVSAVFRHVFSALIQDSCVFVVLVIDEGELVPSLLCNESKRSDETGEIARDVGFVAKAEEKYVVSWIKVVSEAGVGPSDDG